MLLVDLLRLQEKEEQPERGAPPDCEPCEKRPVGFLLGRHAIGTRRDVAPRVIAAAVLADVMRSEPPPRQRLPAFAEPPLTLLSPDAQLPHQPLIVHPKPVNPALVGQGEAQDDRQRRSQLEAIGGLALGAAARARLLHG